MMVNLHRSAPEGTPLSLPPDAANSLNAPEPLPHPDSEEFQRHDRFRTSHELAWTRDAQPLTSRSDARSSPCFRGCAPNSQTNIASNVPEPIEQRLRKTDHSRRLDGVTKFWTRHISVTIDEGAHRDHLALERTFLGYLRTSLAFAVAGVTIAQLFRIQPESIPDAALGYFSLGKPLATSFICAGIAVLLLGACRFWRQQRAMIRGKAHAGGWEITGIMAISLLLCCVTFILLIWVAADGSHN